VRVANVGALAALAAKKKAPKPKPAEKKPARPRKEHAAASTDQFEVTT
jgi:hypothetical protein